MDRANVGYGYPGIFKNGVAQIPSFGGTGWTNQEAALVFNPGGFEAGGPVAGLVCRQVDAQLQRHRYQGVGHAHGQRAASSGSGFATPSPPITTPTASCRSTTATPTPSATSMPILLYGNLYSYYGNIFNRINDIAYNTYEGFVQDSWKVNRRLTLELGLRLTHFQPWIDRTGLRLFDLQLRAVQILVPAHRNTAALNGISATPRFRWAASRRARCSSAPSRRGVRSERARARPSSAADGAAITTTRASSPAAWMWRPACRPTAWPTTSMDRRCWRATSRTLNVGRAGAFSRRGGQQGRQATLHRQLQLHGFATNPVVRPAGSRLCRQPQPRPGDQHRRGLQHQPGSGGRDAIQQERRGRSEQPDGQ